MRLLDEAERSRWSGYRRDEDRQRFLAGCALAKLALAASGAGHGDPARIILDRNCARCGKPHGKPAAAGSGLELSVSHSGDRIAVAVTEVAPVGIDVERQRELGDLESLSRYVLADSERAAVTSSAELLVLWSRKEAVTKATGDGLGVPFKDVVVSGPGDPARLIAWPYPRAPGTVTLADLDLGPGYSASLAVLAGPGRAGPAEIRDGSALLAEASGLR